jgi:hypothetical protein
MGKREHARWRARQLEAPLSDEMSEFAAIVQAESALADGTAIWGMDGAGGAETDIITQIAQAAEWVAWSADEPETEVAQPDEAAKNERLAPPEDRMAVTRPWWAAASIATGMVVGCGLATGLILMPQHQAPAPAAPRAAPPSAPTVSMAEPEHQAPAPAAPRAAPASAPTVTMAEPEHQAPAPAAPRAAPASAPTVSMAEPEHQAPAPAAPRAAPPSAPTVTMAEPEHQAPAPAAPRAAPPSAPAVTMAEPEPTVTVTPPPPSTVTATVTSTVSPAPTKVVDILKTVEPRRPYFSPDYHNVCIDKYGMPQPAFLVGGLNPACFFTP